MHEGKLSENILKRSIFRQIHLKRDDILYKAGVGTDASVLRLEPDELAVLSSDPVIWTTDADAKRAVWSVCNDLAATGAVPAGLLLTALLPPQIEELEIRQMVSRIAAACEPAGIMILGGHTEITPAVNTPVISVTGVGKAKEHLLILPGGAQPMDDIIVTKWIGLEGTSRIASRRMEELTGFYPRFMLEEAAGFDRYLSCLPEATLAAGAGVHAMHDISEGGIFGALWEMAESAGIGLKADLKQIPLRQETVEICNYYSLNPYQLVSGGSMLMAAEDGNALVSLLKEHQIPAVIIGKMTAGNDRILLNEDETRYLGRPEPDEIHKILSLQ